MARKLMPRDHTTLCDIELPFESDVSDDSICFSSRSLALLAAAILTLILTAHGVLGRNAAIVALIAIILVGYAFFRAGWRKAAETIDQPRY